MMMRPFQRLQAEVLDPSAAAAAGAAGAPAPAPAPAAATPATAPAPASSALAAAAPPAQQPLAERIPEKYRVTKDDGSLDLEASLLKVDEARGHLEKRLGSGDLPPKAAGEYKVTVPEAMAEALKDWKPAEDQKLQAFLADAHKAGVTQAQLDLIMGRYFEMAPALAAAAQQLTPEQQAEKATTELKGVWKSDAEFQANLGHAYRASVAFGKKVGLSFDQIEEAGLANNPTFMRIMAAIGPELGEDSPIEGNETATADWDAQVRTLRAEKNALPERDPRRQDIQAKINALYEKRYGKA